MPAPSLRLDWGESVVAVSPDGASVTLHTGGRPALGVHLAGAVPLGLSATDVDEAEHTFSLGGMRVFQRHAVAESWRWRWVVANESASPVGVGLELDLAVEAGWSAWCWAAGAAGLVIVSPRSAPGPVLVVQFEQGHLEWGDPGGSGGGLPGLPGTVPAGRFRLTPEGLALAPGQRWVVAATARWVGDVGAASMLLPPWMEPVHLLGGEPWGARLADVGVTVTDPVSTWYDEVEGVVWVLGPPGTHQVGVHGPRGVTLVDVDWAPPIEDALAAVVSRTLAERLGGMGAAEAFCLQTALERSVVPGTAALDDALDRFDWTCRPELLAIAFGVARATRDGEAAMVGEAVRALASAPVDVGYGRVVMRAWLASLGLGTDVHERCLALLGRPAVDDRAGLESSLLHYRSADAGMGALAGVIAALGGDLPGGPVGVGWVEQAALVGLLELCPEEWPLAPLAARTAEKTRRRVLAAYADGRIRSAEPLAWLLLGAVG